MTVVICLLENAPRPSGRFVFVYGGHVLMIRQMPFAGWRSLRSG